MNSYISFSYLLLLLLLNARLFFCVCILYIACENNNSKDWLCILWINIFASWSNAAHHSILRQMLFRKSYPLHFQQPTKKSREKNRKEKQSSFRPNEWRNEWKHYQFNENHNDKTTVKTMHRNVAALISMKATKISIFHFEPFVLYFPRHFTKNFTCTHTRVWYGREIKSELIFVLANSQTKTFRAKCETKSIKPKQWKKSVARRNQLERSNDSVLRLNLFNNRFLNFCFIHSFTLLFILSFSHQSRWFVVWNWNGKKKLKKKKKKRKGLIENKNFNFYDFKPECASVFS